MATAFAILAMFSIVPTLNRKIFPQNIEIIAITQTEVDLNSSENLRAILTELVGILYAN